MRQPYAAQHVRRLGELDTVVANDLDAIAPRVSEVEERSRQHLNACLGHCPAGRVLVVHNKTKVAPTVRRLAASLLKREELVTKVDEGHVLAFTAKLEFKNSFVERQSYLDVAHFKGNVVETPRARSSGFGHEILTGRAVRGLDRNLEHSFQQHRASGNE